MEDILSIVDPDIRKPFNMKEVVLRLVDDSRLSDFKPNYGTNLLTCFSKIMGMFGHLACRSRDGH
jgi:acetyl-CoA carboxylase carboxyltransferase component